MRPVGADGVDSGAGPALVAERDPTSAGREGGLIEVVSGIAGEAALATAVGIHLPNRAVSAAVALERDPLAVGRVGGVVVLGGVGRQPPQVAPIGLHREDLQAGRRAAAADERDPSVRA